MAIHDSNATDANDYTIVAQGTSPWVTSNTLYRPKTFIVRSPATAIGNNKSMISILNAATVKVRIQEIRIINAQTTAITGIISNFQLNRISAHSAGTSLTPLPFDTTDTLNASITARTNATFTEVAGPITLKEAKFSSDEWGVGAQDVESSQYIMQLLGKAFYEVSVNNKPLTLNNGEGIHIKQTVNSAVGSFDLEIVFTEEAT